MPCTFFYLRECRALLIYLQGCHTPLSIYKDVIHIYLQGCHTPLPTYKDAIHLYLQGCHTHLPTRMPCSFIYLQGCHTPLPIYLKGCHAPVPSPCNNRRWARVPPEDFRNADVLYFFCRIVVLKNKNGCCTPNV